jgi:succinylarginine dihydrolase
MAMLAFGSSFWHASHTRLGGDMDEKSIHLFIYAAYTGAVQNLVADSKVM